MSDKQPCMFRLPRRLILPPPWCTVCTLLTKKLSKNLQKTFKNTFSTSLKMTQGNSPQGEHLQQEGDTKEFSFQLTDPIRRNVYQFRTESSEETNLWLHHLNQAVNVNNINKRSSKNLMSFDWTNYSNLFLLCPQALIENEIKCHVIKLSHVFTVVEKIIKNLSSYVSQQKNHLWWIRQGF